MCGVIRPQKGDNGYNFRDCQIKCYSRALVEFKFKQN